MSLPGDLCRYPIYLCAIRVATLDADGNPDGFIYANDLAAKLTIDPQYEDGEEINVKNGCGTIQATAQADDQFKRLNMQLELTSHDPDLYQMLTNGTLITFGGDSIGYRMPAVGNIVNNGVSLEAWVKNYVGNTQDTTYPWTRFVTPKTTWRIGSRDLGELASPNILIGRGFENPLFLDGPANDLVSGEHEEALSWIFDTTLPTTVCGRSALVGS